MTLLKSVFIVILPCSKKFRLLVWLSSFSYLTLPHLCSLIHLPFWPTVCMLAMNHMVYPFSVHLFMLSSLLEGFLPLLLHYYSKPFCFTPHTTTHTDFFLEKKNVLQSFIYVPFVLPSDLSILISKLYVRLICREIKNPF